MRNENHLLERMLLRAELAGESMPGQFLLEIIGTHRVLIENHLGVICYDPAEICVRTPQNCVCICGIKLLLAEMTKHRLIITGTICCVQFK